MTARAAARKRSRPERPESDRALPSELERESSRRSFWLAARVVGSGSGFGIHYGEENEKTLSVALNYALAIFGLERFEDVKALLRKLLPVARRVLGESNDLTLRMRINYAMALYADTSATLDDIREAVAMLEETARTGRRVLGGTHPLLEAFEGALQQARAALAAREAPPTSA